ncbi:MAG: methionyl-tRNA formyltransferase [Hyphomicrobiales bacterium]
MGLRVIFMGTPDFAVATLKALRAAGHDIVAVYTRAPRPAGRGMAERRSPVHVEADAHGITVLTPRTLRTPEAQAEFAGFGADVAVVVAYGLILPLPVLEAPRLCCLNLHGSLLPRWRGAAPIQRAVMAGDAETGVMVMKMEEGLDTGPVAMTARTPIGADETAGELHDRLAGLGAGLMVEALAALAAGELRFVAQAEEGVTYAAKIEKAEARIDWTRPATAVHDHIRGLSPFPGAWCEFDPGGRTERVKILATTLAEGRGAPGEVLDDALTIACGEGAVRLCVLQRAGKQSMEAPAFLRGAAIERGKMLT